MSSNTTPDLSVLIPARNEMFLSRTVEGVLKNIRGNTEVIVVLDGAWADPPVRSDDRLTIIYNKKALGQRAATNQACRLSKAKYVMKLDAHCIVDEGFDVKMMALMKDHYTMVPVMYNLHAFDWVCQKCGDRQYQGPSEKYKKCDKCDGERVKEIVWKPRLNKKTTAYRFDKDLKFQYWGDYKERQKSQGDLGDSLSILGACFMLTRERYWALNICDEGHGSWGQQGTEVSLKTWLSGGEVKINMTTWFSHMFRTQGGDFGFPYPLSGGDVDRARRYSRGLFLDGKWEKAIHPLSWVLDKFYPVPDWHDIKVKDANRKGIIYYTDNQLNLKVAHAVQNQLKSIKLPIVSASLKPMNFGKNIHVPMERGYLAMFKQILTALEASTSEIVFFCEHDVLYHPSHFDFIPPDKNTFYYNINVWKVRREDGFAVWVDKCIQVSGISVYRETAIQHYRERVALAEAGPWDRNWGYEPGTPGKHIFKTQYKQETYKSLYPNLDIRHDKNLTLNRWSIDKFRDKKNAEGWTESHVSKIPGWETFKLP